jgi:hypothetical protein
MTGGAAAADGTGTGFLLATGACVRPAHAVKPIKIHVQRKALIFLL